MDKSTIIKVLSNKNIIAGTAFSVGVAVGVGVSNVVLKKKLSTKYEEIAEVEIAKAKKFYSALNKEGEYSDPVAMAARYDSPKADPEMEKALDLLRTYQGTAEAPASTEEELMVTVERVTVEGPAEDVMDVFTQDGPDVDFDSEVRKRTSDVPYVITFDEFYNSDQDYEQFVLTYFEEDGVLVDLQEKPIEDVDNYVGDHNLSKFGQWSKDPNVVYVRNDELELDVEITRSKGSYEQEVVGISELRHSDTRRRFRYGDDE